MRSLGEIRVLLNDASRFVLCVCLGFLDALIWVGMVRSVQTPEEEEPEGSDEKSDDGEGDEDEDDGSVEDFVDYDSDYEAKAVTGKEAGAHGDPYAGTSVLLPCCVCY